jgi:hypothetical protein
MHLTPLRGSLTTQELTQDKLCGLIILQQIQKVENKLILITHQGNPTQMRSVEERLENSQDFRQYASNTKC